MVRRTTRTRAATVATASEDDLLEEETGVTDFVKVRNIRGQVLDHETLKKVYTGSGAAPVFNPVVKTYIRPGEIGELPRNLFEIFKDKRYVEAAD